MLKRNQALSLIRQTGFVFFVKKKSCSEREWPVIPIMGYVGEEEAVIVVEK